MSLSQRQQVAESWTDEELRTQLDLVLWEHKRIPQSHRDDRDAEYRRVMDWYSVVCAEYRRRGKENELNERVAQYRNRGKK